MPDLLPDPIKDRRSYLGPATDSGLWDKLALRAGDIFISTPPKAGTTWTQAILAFLLHGPDHTEPLPSISPWVDFRRNKIEETVATLEAQPYRRLLKTHTPMDGLPLRDDCLYVCVYRHPLDLHFSMRKHVQNIRVSGLSQYYPDDFSEGLRMFIEGGLDGADFDAPSLEAILHHYLCAKAIADRPNVLMLHYADMKRDLPSEVATLCEALDLNLDEAAQAAVVEAAGFTSMKSKAEQYVPGAGTPLLRNTHAFFDSASSKKWEGKLTDADLAAYDARMAAALSPEDRRWVEWGSGA